MRTRKITALSMLFGLCFLIGGCLRGWGEGINDGVSSGISSIVEELIVQTIGGLVPGGE